MQCPRRRRQDRHHLPELSGVDPADAGLAFFVYRLVLNVDLNRYVLTLKKTVYVKQPAEPPRTKVAEAVFQREIAGRFRTMPTHK